jgi:hypothetical protein
MESDKAYADRSVAVADSPDEISLMVLGLYV